MKTLLLGMAAAALLGGCANPPTQAERHLHEQEHPCWYDLPYRCKLAKEAEATHRVAVELQEEAALSR